MTALLKKDDLELAMSKARIQVMMHSAFFSSLLLSTPLRAAPDKTKTISAGRTSMVYNPTWLENTDNKYYPFLLLHEALHIAFEHGARRGERDPDIWNSACDIWVNETIAKGIPLPVHPQSLRNPALADQSVEIIYKILKDMQQQDKRKDDPQNDPSSPPDPNGAPGNDPNATPSPGKGPNAGVKGFPGPDIASDPDDAQDDGSAGSDDSASTGPKAMLARAVQAAVMANEMGNMPAELRREVGEVLAPKVSWQEMLRRFVSERVKHGVTWTKRNRRFTDIYLPSHETLGINEIVIAIDTSGSINAQQFGAFMGELNAIRAEVHPQKTHVVMCDAKIQDAKQFDAYEDIDIKIKGGGGTKFDPVWDFVKKMPDKPALIVYFTDGMGRWGNDPGVPVLWALTGRNVSPPFGEKTFII